MKTPPGTDFGVYMLLYDRPKLVRTIKQKQREDKRYYSNRAIARAAGWKSHTFLLRMLDGKVNSCRPEAAQRIATYLGQPVDTFFVARPSNTAGRSGEQNGKVKAA